jgi:hypothetical protein
MGRRLTLIAGFEESNAVPSWNFAPDRAPETLDTNAVPEFRESAIIVEHSDGYYSEKY